MTEPSKLHECPLLAPRFRMGSVWACPECGRHWVLAALGFSFKEWRRTIPTTLLDLIRGRPAKSNWASAYRTPQDRRGRRGRIEHEPRWYEVPEEKRA